MDWVVRVRHCTSGSLVRSDLGVREMWVALLDKNVATHGRRCDGERGRMELNEGWERVVQVLLFWSNLTQDSWMRILSVVWCVIIIIIIFQETHAAYRLWRGYIHFGLKPFVVLLSLQFLVKHSVEVLLLFCSDSPCYLPCVLLSAAYKRMKENERNGNNKETKESPID